MKMIHTRAVALGVIAAALLVVATCLTALVTGGPADATSSARCGRWTQGTYARSRHCVVVTGIKAVFAQRQDYLLHNSHRHQTIKATCAWDHSTTWTWHVDATVKAEAGLIFSKVSAEVSGGVQHSTTDSTHLGFEFTIPPNRWAYCARGHVGFKVTGRAWVQNCGNTGCDRTNRRSFTATIPQSAFIDNGPGRDVDWSQYLPS